MHSTIDERVLSVARYIAENGATVRTAAAVFGISKSTVHKDMTEKLRSLNAVLFREVTAVLMKNKAERHIRGGLATHMKYARLQAFSCFRADENLHGKMSI